jgi:hypothetical protein
MATQACFALLNLSISQVFKIMWPELAGRVNDNITVITADTKFAGEQIATKIRWFVVVKAGQDCCSCLYVNLVSLLHMPY